MIADRIDLNNTPWQSEQLISCGEQYFQGLCRDIEQAQQQVLFEAYIFKLDQSGQRLLDSLIAALDRGVEIQLLVDGLGSLKNATEVAQRLSKAGGHARIFHPPPWYWRAYHWSLEKGHRLRKLLYFLLALNRRNHRKLVVIDRRIAWVGSFNICDSHLSQQQAGDDWRDYAVRVTGTEVDQLAASFEQLWQKRHVFPLRGFLTHYLSNLSPYDRRLKRRYLLHRIATCQQRLWICSAYFAPHGALIRAIKKAYRRGVDVRLLVPSRSDIALFPALTASYYSDLLKHGIRVFEYQPAFLHAKVMLLDQQAIIGSTNLNYRSLLHDFELDVLVSQDSTITELEDNLQLDMKNSREVTIDELPRYRKLLMLSWLPRLIRYWM